MAAVCIIQMLKGMFVWTLLASTLLARAHTLTDALVSVSTFNLFELPTCLIYEESYYTGSHAAVTDSSAAISGSDSGSSTAAAPSSSQDADSTELSDAESLLDHSKFLSFEDWKKQNLANIGQSADNVGGGRRQGSDISKERRTQARAINNALDVLGDDAEIELNFGAFDSEAPQPTPWESDRGGTTNADGETGGADDSVDGVSAVGQRKDAGTTCKERFNYASFDCAATVLKTNPECSGSSSILIENKDSYMLNECRAKDKFLILELCDDILIDTIVLANYEFFSSIFHTFRVSVSDRYPVKADKWKELGIFEAKNTREVQAFAIENPLIWARYIKIELLTHYGNEFYCPVSLVRVHGTTMLEEYKNEGDVSRSDEEIMEEAAEVVDIPVEIEQEAHVGEQVSDNSTMGTSSSVSEICENTTPVNGSILEIAALDYSASNAATCSVDDYLAFEANVASNQTNVNTTIAASSVAGSANSTTTIPSESKRTSERSRENTEQTTSGESNVTSHVENQNITARGSAQDSSVTRTSTVSGDNSTSTSDPTKVAPSPPPAPNPTTQESFFKSVNKRLQTLESNSTLSLLYIEEQSRMLRDAFSKVEKRQLAKMNQFLEDLNSTVVDEIRNLRLVYKSLHTTVLDDFEHQQREVSTAASQLAVLTNELVFQKRMTALSSVLIMILFALLLLPRGSTTVGGIDLHSMIAWSPRPASPAKASEISSTGPPSPDLESETQTPPPSSSNLSNKTRQRQCGNNPIKDLHDGANPSVHSSEEDLRFGYANDDHFRFISDSDVNKTAYIPDIQHGLNYDSRPPSIRVEHIDSSPNTLSSPKLPHDRPVSSPPVLNTSGLVSDGHVTPNGETNKQDDDDDRGSYNDTTTIEPFPPFPSN